MVRGKVAQVTLRLPMEMDEQLFALAKRNHITKTEQIRRLLVHGLSQKNYQEDESNILANMQTALREVLDPQIDRFAKLGSKNAIASSVNLLLTSMLLSRLCAPDSRPKLEQFEREARKMGIRFVQYSKGSIENFLESSMEQLNAMWEGDN